MSETPETRHTEGRRASAGVAARPPVPVIAPGHSFSTVTDKISAIVLTRSTGLGWWFGFGIAFLLVNVLLISLTYLIAEGTGIWGVNVPVGWGLRDHQLRLVDRHRPRRHAHLGDSACSSSSRGARRSTGSPKR
jgi:hypothetical protein